MGGGEGTKTSLSLPLLMMPLTPSWGPQPHDPLRHYLPKAPPSNTITLEIGVFNIWIWGIQTVIPQHSLLIKCEHLPGLCPDALNTLHLLHINGFYPISFKSKICFRETQTPNPDLNLSKSHKLSKAQTLKCLPFFSAAPSMMLTPVDGRAHGMALTQSPESEDWGAAQTLPFIPSGWSG